MRFFYHKLVARVGLTLLSLLGILLYIFLMIKITVSFYSIICALLVLLSCYILIEIYSKTIYIDVDGITYHSICKKYEIAWKDIQHIDIRGMGSGRGNRIDVLCISREYINSFDIEPKNMNNDFIIVLNINQKIINEIKKYWNGRINGLNAYGELN